ncbi:MAG: hypothetical protein LCI00_24460 [Chloroflexi bacterium]|nr:hypothetical protein [Chloroflexota bacterium]
MDDKQLNRQATTQVPHTSISGQQDGIDFIAAYTTLIDAYMKTKIVHLKPHAGVDDYGKETI